MPSLVIYQPFYEELLQGTHDFDNDTFKCLFSNTTPDITHDLFADLTDITAENGYTAGGVTLDGVTVSRTAGVAKVSITDEVFTASGGTVGPFEHFIVYNSSATDSPLVGYVTRTEGAVTLSDGESITLDFDGTNGAITLQASA
jgi:hypothetical protein